MMERHEFEEFISMVKDVNAKTNKLAKIQGYANDLAKTDYRGNPPVEHEIAKKLKKMIEE